MRNPNRDSRGLGSIDPVSLIPFHWGIQVLRRKVKYYQGRDFSKNQNRNQSSHVNFHQEWKNWGDLRTLPTATLLPRASPERARLRSSGKWGKCQLYRSNHPLGKLELARMKSIWHLQALSDLSPSNMHVSCWFIIKHTKQGRCALWLLGKFLKTALWFYFI